MSGLQVRIPKCFVCKAHHLFANALPIHRPYHLSKSRHARSQLRGNVLTIFTLELHMDLQDILKLGIHVLSFKNQDVTEDLQVGPHGLLPITPHHGKLIAIWCHLRNPTRHIPASQFMPQVGHKSRNPWFFSNMSQRYCTKWFSQIAEIHTETNRIALPKPYNILH